MDNKWGFNESTDPVGHSNTNVVNGLSLKIKTLERPKFVSDDIELKVVLASCAWFEGVDMAICKIRIVVAEETDCGPGRRILQECIVGERKYRWDFVHVGDIDTEDTFDEQSAEIGAANANREFVELFEV